MDYFLLNFLEGWAYPKIDNCQAQAQANDIFFARLKLDM